MNDRPDPTDGQARPAVQRWRIVYAVEPDDAEGARQARQAAWDQAIRSSGLPVAGLDGEPPRPRYAPAAPLAPAVAGEAELLDLWLTERLPRWRVRDALAGVIPVAHRLIDVFDVWPGEAALPGRVAGSVYRIELVPAAAGAAGATDPAAVRAVVAAMLAAASLPRERARGEGRVAYDLRPFLDALEVVEGSAPGRIALRMTLRHDPERGVGRPDEVLAEVGDRLGAPVVAVSTVREGLVLRDGPVVAATTAASAPRDRSRPGARR